MGALYRRIKMVCKERYAHRACMEGNLRDGPEDSGCLSGVARFVGTTLVELIGVMIVIAILAAIAIGGIIAARNNANITSTQSDLRTFQSAIQQVLMAHPEVMQATDDAQNGHVGISDIISFINIQLETDWQFKQVKATSGDTTTGKSGLVGTTTIKHDSWNNPYSLYIYTDTNTTDYAASASAKHKESDSMCYIIVASSGPNSTGVGGGFAGGNYINGEVNSVEKAINNTDGVDDLGVIIRVLDGDSRVCTFGYETATLGELKKIGWVFGKSNNGGLYCKPLTKQESDATSTYPNFTSSIDIWYSKDTRPSQSDVATSSAINGVLGPTS